MKQNTQADRTQPSSQSHPIDIIEKWKVSMQRKYEFDDLDLRVETPWFTFKKKHVVNKAGTELVVSMRYTSHADHVIASELDEYRKRVEEVGENAAFLIYKRAPVRNLLTEFLKAITEE